MTGGRCNASRAALVQCCIYGWLEGQPINRRRLLARPRLTPTQLCMAKISTYFRYFHPNSGQNIFSYASSSSLYLCEWFGTPYMYIPTWKFQNCWLIRGNDILLIKDKIHCILFDCLTDKKRQKDPLWKRQTDCLIIQWQDSFTLLRCFHNYYDQW